MASSGWQGQKNVQTSVYPHMALNLYINSISHSGTTLTFKGYVQVVCTSGYISYNGASVSLTGGGSKSINLNLNSSGTKSANTGTFTCTISNVSQSTTSRSVTASLSAGSVASGSASWTIYFDASAQPPSGVTATNIVTTWQSITSDIAVSNWGGGTGKSFELKILNRAYVAGVSALQDVVADQDSATITIDNNSTRFQAETDTVPDLKGCGHYYLGVYATNHIAETRYQAGEVYLPPAPVSVTYARVTNTNKWNISMTGVAANNIEGYDTTQLTRTISYQADGAGDWIYLKNAEVAAITDVTTFQMTIAASHYVKIKFYMTYKGSNSEVYEITITNSDTPAHTYGSVSGLSKELAPIYCSVSGVTKHLEKLYMPDENGLAKLIYTRN